MHPEAQHMDRWLHQIILEVEVEVHQVEPEVAMSILMWER